MYCKHIIDEVLCSDRDHGFYFRTLGLNKVRRLVNLRKKTVKRRYALGDGFSEMYFTHREAGCVEYLITGKTARVIAEILNLSPRTIECYIDNIKKNLDCNTKSRLIKCLFKIDLKLLLSAIKRQQ